MNLVYTAIYGGYDKLWQPKVVDEGWEYRCYTDVKIEGGVWKVIGKKLPDVTDTKASRYIKIMHPVGDFDNILWIDGSIEIIKSLNEFIKALPKCDILVQIHPSLNSLKGELDACKRMNKDNHEIMNKQVERYVLTEPYEHAQTNILLKRNNVQSSMEKWWNEVKEWSKRDQLSFVWAMQQTKQGYCTFSNKLADEFFHWHKFHDK